MIINDGGERKTAQMPTDYFTGTAWIDMLLDPPLPARAGAAHVTFEPGARTAWHTHPLGQMLHIIAGHGRVQTWGGPLREVRQGDVVWFSPGEKHWHGAAPDSQMTHLAITEAEEGVSVVWLEKVSDAQYNGEA